MGCNPSPVQTKICICTCVHKSRTNTLCCRGSRFFQELCALVALCSLGVDILLTSLWHGTSLLKTFTFPVLQRAFVKKWDPWAISIAPVGLRGVAAIVPHFPRHPRHLSWQHIRLNTIDYRMGRHSINIGIYIYICVYILRHGLPYCHSLQTFAGEGPQKVGNSHSRSHSAVPGTTSHQALLWPWPSKLSWDAQQKLSRIHGRVIKEFPLEWWFQH